MIRRVARVRVQCPSWSGCGTAFPIARTEAGTLLLTAQHIFVNKEACDPTPSIDGMSISLDFPASGSQDEYDGTMLECEGDPHDWALLRANLPAEVLPLDVGYLSIEKMVNSYRANQPVSWVGYGYPKGTNHAYHTMSGDFTESDETTGVCMLRLAVRQSFVSNVDPTGISGGPLLVENAVVAMFDQATLLSSVLLGDQELGGTRVARPLRPIIEKLRARGYPIGTPRNFDLRPPSRRGEDSPALSWMNTLVQEVSEGAPVRLEALLGNGLATVTDLIRGAGLGRRPIEIDLSSVNDFNDLQTELEKHTPSEIVLVLSGWGGHIALRGSDSLTDILRYLKRTFFSFGRTLPLVVVSPVPLTHFVPGGRVGSLISPARLSTGVADDQTLNDWARRRLTGSAEEIDRLLEAAKGQYDAVRRAVRSGNQTMGERLRDVRVAHHEAGRRLFDELPKCCRQTLVNRERTMTCTRVLEDAGILAEKPSFELRVPEWAADWPLP